MDPQALPQNSVFVWRRFLDPPPASALWLPVGFAFAVILLLALFRRERRVRGLVVPSLINQSQVLDLLPGASMLRFLAAGGTRPLLVDWGAPGELERSFTLTDYVAGRLARLPLWSPWDSPDEPPDQPPPRSPRPSS